MRAGEGSAMTERRTAAVVGGVTFAAYMIGAGRPYGFDAAVTMDRFVRHSPFTAFDRQLVVNNHPLFSFAESLVFDVAQGEVTMRVLPCLFAALAVGVLVWRVARAWGPVPGVVAGLVLATNPLVVPLFRDVRGYSLATLGIVVAGVAAVDRRPTLFALAAFVGVGTHVWAAAAILALVVWLAVVGELDQRWRVRLLLAAVGVLAVYGWMLDETTASNPVYLRFGYWLIPGLAVAAGWLARQPRLVPVALVALVVTVTPQVGSWTRAENGNRDLAEHARGDECLPPLWPNDAVAVYLPTAPRAFTCDRAVIFYPHRLTDAEAAAVSRWPQVCARTSDGQIRASTGCR